MGNCCFSKKNNTNIEGKAKKDVKDEIHFNKTSFVMNKTEKFRENYLIGQSMGCGIFGEVRKCKHSKSNVIRAVKILRKEKMSKFEIERFTHEIEVMKRLDHPNITKLCEYYEDDKRYYLVMELCTGGELFDELTLQDHMDEETASVITN
mgnify:CR=1 FL=1